MSRFVMGDIHGAYKALVQCLERSNFNKETDTLIQLGDVADGWSEVYQCVEELLSIKNLISIKGNHDQWFLEYLLYKQHPILWQQGGDGTLKSYCKQLNKLYHNMETGGYTTSLLPTDIPMSHINFFNDQELYYKDHKNNIFVHGGFNRNEFLDYLKIADPIDFYWNRDLWNQAMSCGPGQKLNIVESPKEVFIGHTATVGWSDFTEEECFAKETGESLGMKMIKRSITTPMHKAQIWNLDTGAGWHGKLTIMDIDTHEFWQSDDVKELYINEKGR